MKRLFASAILVVAASMSGCAHGPYAFFRDPAEQQAINDQYTRDLMARQGLSNAAVGSTSTTGEGTVGSWK